MNCGSMPLNVQPSFKNKDLSGMINSSRESILKKVSRLSNTTLGSKFSKGNFALIGWDHMKLRQFMIIYDKNP